MKNRFALESCTLEIGKGYLTDCLITADGADATVELFDGKNDNGKPIFKGLVKDGYTWGHVFKTWPFFETGLYLKINAITTHVNIGWREQ